MADLYRPQMKLPGNSDSGEFHYKRNTRGRHIAPSLQYYSMDSSTAAQRGQVLGYFALVFSSVL